MRRRETSSTGTWTTERDTALGYGATRAVFQAATTLALGTVRDYPFIMRWYPALLLCLLSAVVGAAVSPGPSPVAKAAVVGAAVLIALLKAIGVFK